MGDGYYEERQRRREQDEIGCVIGVWFMLLSSIAIGVCSAWCDRG